ncbi:MAG: aspartate aminotransferase family protein [Spirochaetia bacterium]|jgi:acetylornithine/N-succinyldiaminopimelate aminotransferase
MEMTHTESARAKAALAEPALVSDLPFPPQYGSELLVLSRGRGVWLEDAGGKRYLDFAGGIAVNALGYGRADLSKTAMRQMQRLSHVSNLFTTEPALALARAMLAQGPFKFSSVYFGNSGTEANEAALKYARLYSLRTKGPGHEKLLCFSGAFHGRTLGALSCTPTAKYQDPYLPLIPGVVVAPYNDPQSLARTLTEEFAGVIVEVIQGEGGLAAMTPEFARALNEACRRTSAILIADEIQTGMARTGTFYASEGVGLQPDIVTLAKPLGGGLPLSAVLIPAKVNDLIHLGDHGTTFGGGPVTTAVAGIVWGTVSKPEFVQHVQEMGELLQKGLQRIKAAHPEKVGELRGRGLLRGFEYLGGDVKEFLDTLRARGMLALRSGANVIRIAPPLIISGREIETGITIMEEALR